MKIDDPRLGPHSVVKTRLDLENGVWVALAGNIAGVTLLDSRLTLEEAEQIRDELDRVITSARTGGCV